MKVTFLNAYIKGNQTLQNADDFEEAVLSSPHYEERQGAMDLTEVRNYQVAKDGTIDLEFANGDPIKIKFDAEITELLDNHFEAKIEAEMHDNADDAKWEIISDVLKRLFGKHKK